MAFKGNIIITQLKSQECLISARNMYGGEMAVWAVVSMHVCVWLEEEKCERGSLLYGNAYKHQWLVLCLYYSTII